MFLQIAKIDEECINALLTLEHLSLLGQTNDKIVENGQMCPGAREFNGGSLGRYKRAGTLEYLEGPLVDDRIHSMHFDFDILNILPKCQQAELLFSMFTDG